MADKKQLAQAEISRRMNDFIRGRRPAPVPPATAQPDLPAPPTIPPGNAGDGTGAPPPQAQPRNMNDFLRSARLYSPNRSFTTGG